MSAPRFDKRSLVDFEDAAERVQQRLCDEAAFLAQINAATGIADVAPEAGAEDVPRLWTPHHVHRRLADAFEVLRRSGIQTGPAAVRGFWPQIMQEFADLREKLAWEERQEQLAREAGVIHKRPTLDECTQRDKALRWSWQYLADKPLAADALGLWALSTGFVFDPAKVLSARLKRAKAMAGVAQASEDKTRDIGRQQARNASAAWCEAQVMRVRAVDPEVWAARVAQIKTEAWRRQQADVERAAPATIQPEMMMPGKVLRQRAFDRYRIMGATIVARGLNRDEVMTW